MSLEVLEEHVNPLLGRKEAKLVIPHPGSGTPDRLTVRRLASEHFKAPVERVFVKSISTRTGGSTALCAVEVYDDAGKAERVVPAYLKNRNLPKEQRVSKKKGEEAKPQAPAGPVKPAEKKTPEAKAAAKQGATKEGKPTEAKETKAPSEAEPRPKA